MNLKPYLFILPGVGTIILLMGSALYVVFAQSFGLYSIMSQETGFKLDYWLSMIQDPILWNSINYSLRTSILGTLGTILFAYPIALWLQTKIPGKIIVIGTIRAPMFIPGLVAAFLLMNIIAYHGIINQILISIGLVKEPIRMANDNFGWSIIILQIWKNLPFALILISGSINNIQKNQLDAAMDLGATKWSRFHRIIFPLTIPALQAALILIFIGALGDFSFAAIAGSRSNYSLSMLMNITATQYYEWENSAVIAMIIMILSGLSALLITLMTQPFSKNRKSIIN